MMSTSGLAQLAFEHGQLHLAFEIAAPVADRLETGGSPPPISTVIYGILSEVHIQWLQLNRARHCARRALQLSALGGYTSGLMGYRILASRLAQLAGDLETAAREIGEALELVKADTPDYVRQEVIAQQVRVDLAVGRPAAARMALQAEGFVFDGIFHAPDLPPGAAITHSMGLLYNSSLHVLLHQARAGGGSGTLEAGIRLAGRVIDGATGAHVTLVALEAHLLRAQLLALSRDGTSPLAGDDAGQADVIAALVLARPEGILGVFVEQGPAVAETLAHLLREGLLTPDPAAHARSVLAAFGKVDVLEPSPPAEAAPSALIEPVTDREREVLALMADGLKYREIAERLFISLNTVRSHVKALYGKLGVNNRTHAVRVARELRIL